MVSHVLTMTHGPQTKQVVDWRADTKIKCLIQYSWVFEQTYQSDDAEK